LSSRGGAINLKSINIIILIDLKIYLNKNKLFKQISLIVIKGDKMAQIRLEVNDYTKQVLDVIKGKHRLKNRDDALKKLVELHGDNYVEREPSEMFLRELDEKYEKHVKKHGSKKMSEQELNKLLGL
jgi:hypothetical protein